MRSDVGLGLLDVNGRCSRGDTKSRHLAQSRQELLRKPVAEVLEVLVGSEILERQHGDRRDPTAPASGDVVRNRLVQRVLEFEHAHQIVFHHPCAAIPACRIALQRAFDDLHETRWQIGPVIRQRCPLPARMHRGDAVERLTFDRIPHGHEVIQEHAEAVDVAGDGGGLTVENFGRQIQRGPNQPWFRQQVLRPDLAGAEIHQDHAAIGFAHDVVRFDVAMEEASLVHGRDGATDINPDERRFLPSEHPPRGQNLRERETFDPLHPQADGSLVLVDAVDGDDVRMPDTREQAAFLDDASRIGRPLAIPSRRLRVRERDPRPDTQCQNPRRRSSGGARALPIGSTWTRSRLEASIVDRPPSPLRGGAAGGSCPACGGCWLSTQRASLAPCSRQRASWVAVLNDRHRT